MSTDEMCRKIKQAVNELPQRVAIKRLGLFGSHARGTAKPDSDIDLLVDFNETMPIGYFELVRIQEALAKSLGQPVDLVTKKALHKEFRAAVLDEVIPIYEG